MTRFFRHLTRAGDRNAHHRYAARLETELSTYREVLDVHALPDIFHYWSNKYVRPKFEQLGFSSPTDVFVQYLKRACDNDSGRRKRFLSLGSGNCDVECGLSSALLTAGLSNFVLECIDVNPNMLARGKEQAGRQELRRWMVFTEADVNRWTPTGTYDVIIANQSLHHFIELETIFANVRNALAVDGFFLADEMIGRNGHMRWPEALVLLRQVWDSAPVRYKYNHALRRQEARYDNWDCSKEGFEGVRSQDILPLLIKQFNFDLFVAFGNLIDVFVDRCFGHNFDPTNPEDTDFIDTVQSLDEDCIERGLITPTHMTAVMRRCHVGKANIYRHLSPAFCVREKA